MFTKLTSILTVGALALSTTMATPVRADDDAAKIIGGLIVGGLIGAAIANDSHNSKRSGHHVSRGHDRGPSRGHDTSYRYDNGHAKRVNLPGNCRVHSGHRSGYSGRCLNDYDYSYSALPSSCAVHVGGHHQTIYRDRCLNQYGYY